MGHAVLTRLVWACCGRRPGIEAWMEGACPQDNTGAEHTVSKLGSECWHSADFCRCLCVYGGGRLGGMWHPPATLLPETFPNDPCPSRICSEISNQIHLPYAPGVFPIVTSMLYLPGAIFCAIFLRPGLSFLSPSGCPMNLLIFKIPGFKLLRF